MNLLGLYTCPDPNARNNVRGSGANDRTLRTFATALAPFALKKPLTQRTLRISQRYAEVESYLNRSKQVTTDLPHYTCVVVDQVRVQALACFLIGSLKAEL